MFNAGNECRFVLPGADPRTVVIYRPLTQEDDNVIEGIYAEINKGESGLGRSILDKTAMRKKAKALCAFQAELIVALENFNEAGDRITDKGIITSFLDVLPVAAGDSLFQGMRGGLQLFEGKA